MVIGIYKVLDLARSNYDTNLVMLNLQRQARQGMNQMVRELRQASWNSIAITNGNQEITFRTHDVIGDPSIRISYFVTVDDLGLPLPLNGRLYQLKREYPAGTVKIITSSISKYNSSLPPPLGLKVTFNQSLGRILNIKLEASEAFRLLGQDRTITFSLTEQIQVRNP